MRKIAKVFVNHICSFSDENLLCIKSQLNNCNLDYFFCFPKKVNDTLELFYLKNTLVNWQLDQKIHFLFLEDDFFESIETYSMLLCSELFYSQFNLKYEYIFILQPDVFIVDNSQIANLLNQCHKKKIDFVGAPLFFIHDSSSILNAFFRWKKSRLFLFRLANKLTKIGLFPKSFLLNIFFVGVNGGSSIRRVEAFINVTKDLNRAKVIEYWKHYSSTSNIEMLNGYFNEDIFWSLIVGKKMKRIKVAKNSVCAKYFWELGDKEVLSSFIKPHKTPLSIHKFYSNYYPNIN